MKQSNCVVCRVCNVAEATGQSVNFFDQGVAKDMRRPVDPRSVVTGMGYGMTVCALHTAAWDSLQHRWQHDLIPPTRQT